MGWSLELQHRQEGDVMSNLYPCPLLGPFHHHWSRPHFDRCNGVQVNGHFIVTPPETSDSRAQHPRDTGIDS